MCYPVYIMSSGCVLPDVRHIVQVCITQCTFCCPGVPVSPCTSRRPGVYYPHVRHVVQVFITPMYVMLSRCLLPCVCHVIGCVLSRCVLPDVSHVVQACITQWTSYCPGVPVSPCTSCCPGVYYPMYVMLSRCVLSDVRYSGQVCIT